MNPKLLTISGYRGIVDQTFTAGAVEKLTAAFAKLTSNATDQTILVCRDGRPSGKDYLNTAIKTLNNLGFETINADILPTPLALFAVKNFNLGGAVVITASHNPIEYNGLKFVGADGLFISPADIAKIKELISWLPATKSS